MLMPSSEGTSVDWSVASVLHAAANSGSGEMFDAVLAAMEGVKLTPDEVPRFNHTNKRSWCTTTKFSIPLCSISPGARA